MADEKEPPKNYFTPCRTVGLKRKSSGTPSSMMNTPKSHKIDESDNKEIDLTKSISNNDEAETPKRARTDSATLIRRNFVKFRKETTNVVPNQVESSTLSRKETDCIDNIDLEIKKTEERILRKLEEIRSLQLETLNVKQHDLEKLNGLTEKWRLACQSVLNELLIEYRTREESCSMMALLSSLGIPASLVRYNEAEMEFYDE